MQLLTANKNVSQQSVFSNDHAFGKLLRVGTIDMSK